eukprot:TRINITY_DN195_c0_g1_i1.p1 TRINITY_DN195_c0_g1~~TRINITY_DN195_c0_g1_i1.p1  ORF type:complete len:250 (-),score=86.14 TRINITY_DN195_c0_g1_i1:141-845(-)
MLRSLVGSEMCIRDRYQRRVRGLKGRHMQHPLRPFGMALVVLGAAVQAIPTEFVKIGVHQPNGLIWPLPDNDAPPMIVSHGIHCQYVAARNETDTKMSLMHTSHCNKIVGLIEQARREHRLDQVMTPLVCQMMYNLTAFYSDNAPDDYSYHWWIHDAHADVANPDTGVIENPSDISKLGGHNYGTLLMKEFYTPEELTEAEQEWLDGWITPDKNRLAATGYVCRDLGFNIYPGA